MRQKQAQLFMRNLVKLIKANGINCNTMDTSCAGLHCDNCPVHRPHEEELPHIVEIALQGGNQDE